MYKTKRFSYDDCTKRMNSVVPLEQSQLPPINVKCAELYECNRILQEYKLPVMYRYMPLNMNAILGILNEDVYMVAAEKLNDVFEGAAFGLFSSFNNDRPEIERIQKNVYVKAFSHAENNTLMWSHYGDAHKGICVSYDFSKAPYEVVRHLYPVQYSNTRFSNSQMSNVASHPFLYLRKSNEWKYEKEFRLLYTKDELNDEPCIKLNCIKEIQFGLRTTPEEKELIANIVERKNKKILLYETLLKDDSFFLEKKLYIREI